MPDAMTLNRFILSTEHRHPGATGEFSALLSHIALAAKVIQRAVSHAGLVDVLGATGAVNVQGEEVKKLDVFANETMVRMFQYPGLLCTMASEEEEDVIPIGEGFPLGKYILNFDPLDGSSNIDANVNIGTIFSIHRRRSEAGPGTAADCMQPGRDQVCAGYVLYGTSTMLVFTTGEGVHGFTLDPSVGEFLLSHRDIRIPARGSIYSTNEGNYQLWSEGMRRYVDRLKTIDKANNLPYKARYIGSLVADFHRTLLYGGIFLYPADSKSPRGKLRLLYEAAPLAMVCEQAGGAATTGSERILDIVPNRLHQRVPLIIGSAEDVAEVERYLGESA
ncbi:MAG: class 1 fructose-bisphosphatase [bacterium]